ncbi:MAG: molybdopterin-dependent oxidoreductase [Desulfomonile sp.]
MRDFTRREFIRLATVMGGASLFAGCTLLGESPIVPEYIKGAPGVDPLETLAGIKNIYTVCALCPGNCGICCRMAQGTVVKIGGSPFHPATADPPLPFETPLDKAITTGGSVCAVGGSGIQTLYDPFRVARPMKRVGPRGSGRWKALSWNDALTEIIDGGNLFGEGNVSGLRESSEAGAGLSFLVGRVDWGALTFIRRFLASFPGSVLLRDGNVNTREIAALAADGVFGQDTGTVDADYKRARCLISFGDAPLDSGEPLVSVAREIASARIRGPFLRWAVVDPRLSTSASKSDLWVPVIPGTDRSLALAIMKALVEHYPAAIKTSREMVEKLISGRTTADYARECGVSSDIPVQLAKYLADARETSAVVPGRGIFSQTDGIETAKLILNLNLMVGSVPGSGGLAKSNDGFLKRAERKLLHMRPSPGSQSQGSGLNSKALIVWEADPVYDDPSTAAARFMDREKVPMLVVIDRELTETAALADYILPDTTYLERWDVCASPPAVTSPGFGVRRPVVGGFDQKNGAYFPLVPETRLLEDILIALGANLRLQGFEPDNPASFRNAWDYYKHTIEAVMDSMKEDGLVSDLKGLDSDKVIERGGLFADSEVVSLRTTEPRKTDPLVSLSPKQQSDEPATSDELTLIAYTLPFHRSPRSVVNTWLLEVLPDNRLIINSADARKRGISQGEKVVVEDVLARVRVECRAHVVPGIRPGVVALARGFGNRQSGTVATLIDGISVLPEKARGAGVNTMSFASAPELQKVKIKKA